MIDGSGYRWHSGAVTHPMLLGQYSSRGDVYGNRGDNSRLRNEFVANLSDASDITQ